MPVLHFDELATWQQTAALRSSERAVLRAFCSGRWSIPGDQFQKLVDDAIRRAGVGGQLAAMEIVRHECATELRRITVVWAQHWWDTDRLR